jgi:two-component system nitrate/nitrite response regulator NarL
MEASSASMRVVLIGRQPLLFQPLARWLTHERAITAEFLDAGDPAVVDRCAGLAPHVAVFDQLSAPAALTSIVAGLRGSLPGIAILLLAERADSAAEATALAAGCRGVVGKDQVAEALVSALCAARGVVVPPAGPSSAGMEPFVPTLRLTLREREVLGLLAAGLSTPRIGKELKIAHNTARAHVQRVIEKLGAHSKLEAVALARRAGMLAS